MGKIYIKNNTVFSVYSVNPEPFMLINSAADKVRFFGE